MFNKHLCPCCSQALLRHISFKRIYWFCSHCHQEMPDLEGVLHRDIYSQHWINNNITKHQPWEESRRLNAMPYSWLETIKELQHLAFLDSLPQVTNRGCFEAYLNHEWRRRLQEQVPLSLMIIELDSFKAYNDTYGRQAGVRCLQKVAKAIVKGVNNSVNLVARYGAEEFVVVLPNTTSDSAVRVAEEIRSEVKALKINPTNSQVGEYLSLSLGVASIIPTDNYSPVMLVTAALRSLYQAKIQGGDRVILHETLLRQTKLLEQKLMPA